MPSPVASNPVPPYPADALARGIEGLVLLRVRIGADGSVEEAAIDQSSGTPSLDESALSTVRRQWRFRAGHPLRRRRFLRGDLADPFHDPGGVMDFGAAACGFATISLPFSPQCSS